MPDLELVKDVTYTRGSQQAFTNSSGESVESYRYDDNGNRLLGDEGSASTTGDNQDNRLLTDGTYRYDYDVVGKVNRLGEADVAKWLNGVGFGSN